MIMCESGEEKSNNLLSTPNLQLLKELKIKIDHSSFHSSISLPPNGMEENETEDWK